jgi:hypothetical protein
MWAMQRACETSRRGREVVFVSQENPLDEDVRRLKRMDPDPDHFRFFHGAGLDLTKPDHIAAFFDACGGAELVVLDTFTACWSGKEDDTPRWPPSTATCSCRCWGGSGRASSCWITPGIRSRSCAARA